MWPYGKREETSYSSKRLTAPSQDSIDKHVPFVYI